MEKEIYKVEYVKDFLRYVVHPIWKKQNKLKPHRPVMYSLTKMKDEKKLTLHLKVRVNLEKMAQKEYRSFRRGYFLYLEIEFQGLGQSFCIFSDGYRSRG